MIKLIITDMDGTFLNSQGDFDQELYRKVKIQMDQHGIIFAPCTGKQCERVEQLFGPTLASDLWILGDSATRIKHNGQYIYQSLLANKLGLDIITELEKVSLEHIIIACTPSCAYFKSSLSHSEQQKVKGSYANVKAIDDLSTIDEDFVKITVYDEQLRCFETREKLAQFFDQAYIIASEAAWIDISNHGVHKGTTVQKLQALLNVTKAQTMVFGDGLNDIELMHAGDFSFAMRNAFDQTKHAARYITGTNDENSVLNTIEQFISLQLPAKN